MTTATEPTTPHFITMCEHGHIFGETPCQKCLMPENWHYVECAALGMAMVGSDWLFENFSSTWFMNVDLNKLDMNSNAWCVLGQLHNVGELQCCYRATCNPEPGDSSGFEHFCDTAGIFHLDDAPIGAEWTSWGLGFTVGLDGSDDYVTASQDYTLLTHAWKLVIATHRGIHREKFPHLHHG